MPSNRYRALIPAAIALGMVTTLLRAATPAEASARPVASAEPDRGLFRLLPTTADFVDSGTGARTESLCYHTGDVYYMKLPHPVYGDVGPLFQRITPGSGGVLGGCELRLLNQFNNNSFHDGTLSISVHRREGGWPSEAVETLALDAGDYGNGVFQWDFSGEFSFDAGEDFFLSLTFDPASPMDTLAYVTADIGDWTGHSFFIFQGETAWWGNPQGEAFGDMHFCARATLLNRQPFLQFPWSRLDFGRCRAGEPWSIRLPILNQGTAPLHISEVSIDSPGWIIGLEGPDSLSFPDTLHLDLTWADPPPDAELEATLRLRSNAADSLREIPLRIASSRADWLLADWNELVVNVVQFADTGLVTGNWQPYQGLHRPETFYGHDRPAGEAQPLDLLAVRDLPIEEGSMVEFRWSQHQRHGDEIDLHAFAWRNPDTGWWQVQEEPDLCEDPWRSPDGEWTTTPWLAWGPAPATAELDFGFLYGGPDANDMWFIDDLEIRVRPPLEAPQVSIALAASGVRLQWAPVAGAARYRVEEFCSGSWRAAATVSGTSWTADRCLTWQRTRLYRVIAEDAPSPEDLHRVDPGKARPLLREDR